MGSFLKVHFLCNPAQKICVYVVGVLLFSTRLCPPHPLTSTPFVAQEGCSLVTPSCLWHGKKRIREMRSSTVLYVRSQWFIWIQAHTSRGVGWAREEGVSVRASLLLCLALQRTGRLIPNSLLTTSVSGIGDTLPSSLLAAISPFTAKPHLPSLTAAECRCDFPFPAQ